MNEKLRPSQAPQAPTEAVPAAVSTPEVVHQPETIESIRAEMDELKRQMIPLSRALFERGKTYKFEGITEKALASLIATEEELDELGIFPDEMARHTRLIPALEKGPIMLDIGDGPMDGNLSVVPARVLRNGYKHGYRRGIIALSIPVRDLKVSDKTDPDLRTAVGLYARYAERNATLKALEKAKK